MSSRQYTERSSIRISGLWTRTYDYRSLGRKAKRFPGVEGYESSVYGGVGRWFAPVIARTERRSVVCVRPDKSERTWTRLLLPGSRRRGRIREAAVVQSKMRRYVLMEIKAGYPGSGTPVDPTFSVAHPLASQPGKQMILLCPDDCSKEGTEECGAPAKGRNLTPPRSLVLAIVTLSPFSGFLTTFSSD